MSSFKLEFDDKRLKQTYKKAPQKLEKELQKSIDNTSGFALRQIKQKISRRSGNLAKSYIVRGKGKFRNLVFSGRGATGGVRYADAVEAGYEEHTITAKRSKFLIIPTTDDVLTPSRAQIRKMSKAEFKQAAKEGKIVFKKQVSVGPFSGTHKIRKKVMPVVRRRQQRETNLAISRALR